MLLAQGRGRLLSAFKATLGPQAAQQPEAPRPEVPYSVDSFPYEKALRKYLGSCQRRNIDF